MIKERLALEGYEKKKNEQGYYSFGVRIESEEFIYLQTNFKQKKSLENWENNFSSGWKMRDDKGSEKIVLFSIEGISLFNTDWNGRRDYELSRMSPSYRALEKLEKSENFEGIGKVIKKIIDRD